MRRTIRLTGRKQLPASCVNVGLREIGQKRVITLGIAQPDEFKGFPKSARLSLRLVENKQMELLDFGTLGSPKAVADLQNPTFVDPSCQLRVATTADEHLGLLLGSTKPWRLDSEKVPEQGGVRGILQFLPKDIAPRAWKLEIREDSHPIVYVDKRIPDPKTWAKSDPIFVATVFPAVIQLLFEDILLHVDPKDTEWMKDWLDWAEAIMPGYSPPSDPGDRAAHLEWIERLIDSFCQRHHLSDRIVNLLVPKEQIA